MPQLAPMDRTHTERHVWCARAILAMACLTRIESQDTARGKSPVGNLLPRLIEWAFPHEEDLPPGWSTLGTVRQVQQLLTYMKGVFPGQFEFTCLVHASPGPGEVGEPTEAEVGRLHGTHWCQCQLVTHESMSFGGLPLFFVDRTPLVLQLETESRV